MFELFLVWKALNTAEAPSESVIKVLSMKAYLPSLFIGFECLMIYDCELLASGTQHESRFELILLDDKWL